MNERRINLDEVNKPGRSESGIIVDYLQKQIHYNDRKIAELTAHLELYPDDEYSKQDKQNCYYLRNVLMAMIRRVETNI